MLPLLLACAAPAPTREAPSTVAEDTGEPPEVIPDDGIPDPDFFADTGVLDVAIELDDAAIAELQAAPTEYVQGTFVFRGRRYEPVGVRLKGNSTYQWLDGRPAWKVKFSEYDPDLRVLGQERLTLDSNYWDGSMMAETLAYRLWRLAGNPAPRTGYANVSFNGELYGLYTIVESMDDGFIDEHFPDSEGGLWEMCRSCDFNRDCSQYEPQAAGSAYDPTGLSRACDAAKTGDEAEIRAHFDWAHLTRYMALERVTNHSDSYSYNRNNYYVYHDPVSDRVSLTPWGADSTFSYTYPPDQDLPCDPGYFDVLATTPGAYLAGWCQGNAACWADMKAEMSAVSAVMVDEDLAGFVEATHDRLADSVYADPRWPWGTDTWEEKVACFHQWVSDRPAKVEAFVASH